MHPAATRTSQQTIEQFGKYVIPNYKRYPVCIVHGEGTAVWDAEGKRYLECRCFAFEGVSSTAPCSIQRRISAISGAESGAFFGGISALP